MPREQRFVFDEAAHLYDRLLPGYPEALFEDVVSLSGIASGDRSSRSAAARVRRRGVWHGGEGPIPKLFAESGGFGSVSTRRYPWSRVYETTDYCDGLRTQSDRRMLPPEQRETLLGAVACAIDSHGGQHPGGVRIQPLSGCARGLVVIPKEVVQPGPPSHPLDLEPRLTD